ncbi:hypothetical protein FDECE_18649, partial [Fusarium decemcellulare]
HADSSAIAAAVVPVVVVAVSAALASLIALLRAAVAIIGILVVLCDFTSSATSTSPSLGFPLGLSAASDPLQSMSRIAAAILYTHRISPRPPARLISDSISSCRPLPDSPSTASP